MRVVCGLVTMMAVVSLAGAGPEAQKNKGQPATATFASGGAITGGAFSGTLDGAFRADLSRTSEAVCVTMDFTGTSPDLVPVPINDNCYEATLVNVHGVNSLPLSSSYGARQMGVSFTDARGYTYTLQFGDAYANPPDYVRGTCLVQTSGSCIAASVDSADSTPHTYPGQSDEPRITGPEARLSVQVGRKKPVEVGIYNVPFQVSISVR